MEGDYLTQGKKTLPVAVLSNTYRKHMLASTPYSYTTSYKGGRGKGKDGKGKDGKSKGRKEPAQSSPSVPDVSDGELWMLPYPEAVNQEDGSYLILGYDNSQIRVTKENWGTLRFNTKTLNPEYFPASYVNPITTGPSLENPQAHASFLRSTITATLEDLRLLLKVPLLNRSKKISQEVYKALCLEGVSGAPNAADERTAPKRIRIFLKLCSVFVPCEYEDYYHAVAQLDVVLNPEFLVAVQPYNVVRDQIVGNISRRIETATSVLLQVLHTLQRGHVQYHMKN